MRWLLISVFVLQILIIGGEVYLAKDPGTDRLALVAKNLETTRTRLAGSLNRLRQQQADLADLQERLLARLEAGPRPPAGKAPESPLTRGEEDPLAETSPPDREQDLLREIEHLQKRRADQEDKGHEIESLENLLDQRVSEFVDRGAPALSLLAEELRSHRDPALRRFILTSVLPPFEALDSTACFRAARQVLMDAAAMPPIRILAARQSLRFDQERALDDLLDLLRLGTGKGAEDLRAGLLEVLADNPVERAAQTVRVVAVNPQWGVKVQTQAIRTLARYPDSRTADLLRRIVDDGLVYAKVAALDSLARISGKDLLPYLAALLEKAPEALASAVRAKALALEHELESE